MGRAMTMRDAIVAAVQTGCNTGIGIEDRCRFPECLCALSIEYMATIRAFLEAQGERADYILEDFNAAAKELAK